MSAVAEPRPGGRPFASASAADLMSALDDVEAEKFARSWAAALDDAKQSLDLGEVHAVLESWRRVAWLVRDLGGDGYRAMLADAERRVATGERPAGSVPWEQLRAELGLPG